MTTMKKIYFNQPILFSLSLVLFLLAAVLGWEKLQYGFNFIDEGYHMTESWRIAADDQFLKEKCENVHMLYVLINSLIFEVFPGITLLAFRKLQYFLTIFSLLFLGSVLYKYNKQYWYLPLIFSIFASIVLVSMVRKFSPLRPSIPAMSVPWPIPVFANEPKNSTKTSFTSCKE